MLKEIDDKNKRITYEGDLEELKLQLSFLFDELIPHWKISGLEKDVKNFEKISEDCNNYSDMYERIYYNNKRIIYMINSSNNFQKNVIFPVIKERCKKADKNFLAMN